MCSTGCSRVLRLPLAPCRLVARLRAQACCFSRCVVLFLAFRGADANSERCLPHVAPTHAHVLPRVACGVKSRSACPRHAPGTRIGEAQSSVAARASSSRHRVLTRLPPSPPQALPSPMPPPMQPPPPPTRLPRSTPSSSPRARACGRVCACVRAC